MTTAEMSRLENLELNALDLTDGELALAAFIAALIAAGHIPGTTRRVCALFGQLDSEIDNLANFRPEYFAHWDGLLADDDDGPPRHFRVPTGTGWPG